MQTSLDVDQFLYFASIFKSQHLQKLLYIGLRPFDKCRFRGTRTARDWSWAIFDFVKFQSVAQNGWFNWITSDL